VSVFFDTNILYYADDADAGAKTGIARDLLRRSLLERTGVVSTQVLQEFYVNARKKLKLDGAAARARIEVYLSFDVVTVSPTLLLAAVDLNRLDSVSFWDALVIRAAEQAGCDTLYSEDLQAGRRFGPVRVVNPFA
jgi:predicted nucleic acid-binding protein